MSDYKSEGLSFFEDVSPTDKLMQIIRHANADIVDKEFREFIDYVSELELEREGKEVNHETISKKSEDISMRLMSTILSQNE